MISYFFKKIVEISLARHLIRKFFMRKVFFCMPAFVVAFCSLQVLFTKEKLPPPPLAKIDSMIAEKPAPPPPPLHHLLESVIQ
jgi:hypothetical protein